MHVYDIFTAEVSQGAKLLWLYLRYEPGVHSQQDLATEIGATMQSVNKYVRELREDGWITVEKSKDSRRFVYDIV